MRYYIAAQSCAMDKLMGNNCDWFAKLKKELNLNAEDIALHIEWLDIIRENSDWTKIDAKELALNTDI